MISIFTTFFSLALLLLLYIDDKMILRMNHENANIFVC